MHDVVVGVDSSIVSERALDRALIEATLSGSALRVVRAWDAPMPLGDIQGMGYADPASFARLELSAQQLVDESLRDGLARRTVEGTVDVTTEVAQGDPGSVLVAASKDAELIVIGGRGHGYVASAVLGSTTGFVLHHAHCPVMVVPAGGVPAGDFARVVVGVDDAPCSRAALAWGVAAALRHACPLVVLHAWFVSAPVGSSPLSLNRLLPDFGLAARNWLRELVAGAVAGHQLDSQTLIAHGPAAKALLHEAGPDDLLVLGSRGRGGFASLVLGSVATQCSHHARGVLTVVRSDEERLKT